MFAWQFCKALYLADRHGWTRFVSMQNHYNLLYREEEREMIPLCADRGHRRDPLEPAGPRPAGPALGRAGRAPSGPGPTSSARRSTPGPRRPTARSSTASARWPTRAGVPRAQVALAWMLEQAGRHVADRRRHQAAPPGRRRRRAVDQADPRGDRAAGGAVRAASRPGVLVTGGRDRRYNRDAAITIRSPSGTMRT